LLWSWLGSETENAGVLNTEFDSGVVLLGEVLLGGFLSSLVFFSFDEGQLFLLKPFSIDLSLNWSLSLGGDAKFNTLALIVLSQSHLFWFLRCLHFLNSFSLSYWNGSSDLFWLEGFFFLDLILDASNVSSSLSWSVFSSSSTSSIEWMSFRNALEWSSWFVVVSDLLSVVSHSNWNLTVHFFSCWLYCLCGTELFQLSSFLVS
jgi:hypothetical protein